jgi:hypothetical protein
MGELLCLGCCWSRSRNANVFFFLFRLARLVHRIALVLRHASSASVLSWQESGGNVGELHHLKSEGTKQHGRCVIQ